MIRYGKAVVSNTEEDLQQLVDGLNRVLQDYSMKINVKHNGHVHKL